MTKIVCNISLDILIHIRAEFKEFQLIYYFGKYCIPFMKRVCV